MPKLYYSVLTSYGSQAFARAMASRQPLNITTFAVGDGNGRAVQPDSQHTSLVREVYRANVSAISLDPRNPRQVIFELTIPENIGGFWIREMGIFDNQNRLVAYANCPDSFKPQLESGSGKVQVLRMILLVSSSDAVTLTVDDSVIFAKRGELTPQTITATSQNSVDQTGHSHAIDHASTSRKGVVQLTNDTGLDSESLALTAKAGKRLAQEIAQNRINTANLANQKVDKTAISDSVSSSSQTSVASSKAVKTANDNANTKVPIDEDCTIGGSKTFIKSIRILTSEAGVNKEMLIGQSNVGAFIRNAYTNKFFVIGNNDKVSYGGYPFFIKGLNNPSWSDVENKPTTLANYGIADFKVDYLSNENLNDVVTAGIYGQATDTNALAHRNYPEQQAGTLLVTNSAYGVQQEYTTFYNNHKYVRGRVEDNWQAWRRVDGIDKVNRAGDKMTGDLEVPYLKVKRPRTWVNLVSESYGSVGLDFTSWNGRHAQCSIESIDIGNFATEFRFHATPQGRNYETDRRQHVATISPTGGMWLKEYGWLHDKFHHATKPYVEVRANNQEYAGLDVVRTGSAGSWRSRFEAMYDKRWKFWIEGSHEIYVPAKAGTVVLDTDFTYQKIGNFEIHKFPNGTMIQTYWQNFSSGYRHDYVYSFNWAVAFVEKPRVFGNPVIGAHSGHTDKFMAEQRNQTSNTKFSYYLFDPGGEQGDWDMQFVAIGRWK